MCYNLFIISDKEFIQDIHVFLDYSRETIKFIKTMFYYYKLHFVI